MDQPKEADNIVYLKPSDCSAAIIACMDARENVALVGPPGCGKSSIFAQAAEASGRQLITSLPSVEDVTEPGGFPWISQDHSHAKKVLFGQAYAAINAAEPTLWLWEDFGQAAPSVQSAYMQWAWAREVNGYRLPDHVAIAMATNRRTDKAGVSGILEPVKGRFTMLHMKSDLDDFCNNLFTRGASYGLNDDMIVCGAAFLRFREELLNQFQAVADMTNSPTERNWVSAFKMCDQKLPKHIVFALVSGRVGVGAATEFVGFLEIYRQLPSLDAILGDPVNAIIPEAPAALFAVAVGLASKATEKNFAQIATYASRLEKSDNGEFAVLLVRDSVRRNERVTSTMAYIKLCSSSIGKLMTGRE